jgi:type IV pilus assembly protein PilA
VSRSTARSIAGFSLAEVLAGITLALTLALLVWPSVVRSRLAANEASAALTIRQISQAELTYASTYPTVGFASRIDELGGWENGCSPRPERACFLEPAITDAPHHYRGYRFSVDASGAPTRTAFFSLAVPVRIGETGQLSFCSTNRWLIHYRSDGRHLTNAEACETSTTFVASTTSR